MRLLRGYFSKVSIQRTKIMDLNTIKAVIRVRLLPRSSTNQIVEKVEDVYKIKVTAPSVNGKANTALIELLAKKLKKPKKSIEIFTGKRSKLKHVRIHGLSLEEVEDLMTV